MINCLIGRRSSEDSSEDETLINIKQGKYSELSHKKIYIFLQPRAAK